MEQWPDWSPRKGGIKQLLIHKYGLLPTWGRDMLGAGIQWASESRVVPGNESIEETCVYIIITWTKCELVDMQCKVFLQTGHVANHGFHSCGTYYAPGTTGYYSITHLIFRSMWYSRCCYYSHFIDEETEHLERFTKWSKDIPLASDGAKIWNQHFCFRLCLYY